MMPRVYVVLVSATAPQSLTTTRYNIIASYLDRRRKRIKGRAIDQKQLYNQLNTCNYHYQVTANRGKKCILQLKVTKKSSSPIKFNNYTHSQKKWGGGGAIIYQNKIAPPIRPSLLLRLQLRSSRAGPQIVHSCRRVRYKPYVRGWSHACNTHNCFFS